MEKFEIYKDIAKRTNGDIYIGVVGPVRTGKSTFISRFLEQVVLPNMDEKLAKSIATDEMPQSADGRMIMTSQPKFIPANAVRIAVSDKMFASVRLVDSVGYFVNGATGKEADGKVRMVKTPWSDKEIPFEEAAELGTRKVITDYSTIGILVTTDGSFGEIPRSSFEPVEKKVVDEMKDLKKPFVIVLNCQDKSAPKSLKLQGELEQTYGVPVVCVNAREMTADEIGEILQKVLFEFPLQAIHVDIPNWMQALPKDNPTIQSLSEKIRACSESVCKMKDFQAFSEKFESPEKVSLPALVDVNVSEGAARFSLSADSSLFYDALSQECGDEITDDYELLSYVKELSKAKSTYKKLKNALACAEETGYGIVSPDESEMEIHEPVLTKQGGRFGVKFQATAPCLHIMKVNLSTEVSPIVGSEKQSEELVDKLLTDYSDDPKKILSTNIFGKTLSEMIGEGLKQKAGNISQDTQTKMRRTVTRITNEGKGGVICILL